MVVVPATGSAAKLAAIEGYGAELRTYDPAPGDREEVAAAIAAERKLTIIRPFDDYDIMAGQGTVGLELIGGGRPATGWTRCWCRSAAAAWPRACPPRSRRCCPDAAVIGVEPAGADDTAAVAARGPPGHAPAPVTIADGLLAEQPGELTFAVNSRLLDDVVTVSEDGHRARPCGSASAG